MASNQMEMLCRALPQGFSISCPLGSGGQGAVFDGSVDGQRAAIKIFHGTHEPKRLERELQLLQKVECPSLVRMLRHATIRVDDVPYAVVAYEFISGKDLSSYTRKDRLPLSAIVRAGHDVGCALEALWAKRIVHRDVKPANIVAEKLCAFVLVDVGFARHVDLSDITAIGGAVGTVGYMSPEQARGRRNLTISSDVFSLGVTLYELVAQRHPFRRGQPGTPTAVAPLRQERQDVPEPLSRLVQEMLLFVPDRRPRDLSARFGQLMEMDTCSS